MRRLLLAFCLLFAALGASAQSPPPNLAGRVELVEGDVTVYDRAKQPRRVAVGDGIFEGEGIVTGPDGELHLAMEDGGFIAVRPNTKMSIAAYRAEGGEQDKSVFSLLAGTFRSVTGWIGKFNPRSYQVRTPTATIGVRGTDHEPLVIPTGSSEGEPGSYDKVNAGATMLRTRHGSIEVRPNQAGFVPLRGRPQPRLLREVPAFFRATRHEPAIAVRHEAIGKVIDRLRDERRKFIGEQKRIERQKDERLRTLQERRQAQEAQRRHLGEEPRRQREVQREQRRQEHLRQREERNMRRLEGAERPPHVGERHERRPHGLEHDRATDPGQGRHGGGRGR